MTLTRTRTRFAHERLDAYRVALELLRGVEALAARFPRGNRDLRNQLRRAGAATVLNIAEGANRIHGREKASRFAVARGECGECAASLQIAEVLDPADALGVDRLRESANRISAMLAGLIRRETRRSPGGAAGRPRTPHGN